MAVVVADGRPHSDVRLTVGLIRLVRLLFPVVPSSNIPGPAVGGRRAAGIWVMSPETTSAVFLAGACLAVARRRHLLRAGTKPAGHP